LENSIINEIRFLGSTYDPLDILMYAIGVGLGIVIDLTIIDKFEKADAEKYYF